MRAALDLGALEGAPPLYEPVNEMGVEAIFARIAPSGLSASSTAIEGPGRRGC